MSNPASMGTKGGVRLDNPVFDMAPFALPSVFWRPSYTRGSLWLEHLPFCFWAVEAARPSCIVTTGMQDGMPYFGLCEAVSRLQLETRCVLLLEDDAPDAELAAYNEERFGSFSKIRSRAGREAMAAGPGDIDLLVLADRVANENGSVADDWDSWLPKLSDRAIVLVPNLAGAGADALWKKLRRNYPHFHFPHGGGLGVAGVGQKLPELFRYLLTLGDRRHSELARVMFNRLGLAIAESYRLMVVRRRLRNTEVHAEDLAANLRLISDRHDAVQGRVEELERELSASARKIELASEHAKRVANAMEALKRDHEQRRVHLEEACGKVVKLEAERAEAAVRAQARLEHTEQQIRDIKGEAASLRRQLKQERKSLQQMERDLKTVLGSRSWAVTAPFRKIAGWTRNIGPKRGGKSTYE